MKLAQDCAAPALAIAFLYCWRVSYGVLARSTRAWRTCTSTVSATTSCRQLNAAISEVHSNVYRLFTWISTSGRQGQGDPKREMRGSTR